MKTLKQYNESVRDKMTPKPKGEVDDLINQKKAEIEKSFLALNKNFKNYFISKEGKRLKLTMSLLAWVQENDGFNSKGLSDEYMMIFIDELMSIINKYGYGKGVNNWTQYIAKRMLHSSGSVMDFWMNVYHYCKRNKIINESVKDMMTPKPETEMREKLSRLRPEARILEGIELSLIWVIEDCINEGVNINKWIQLREMHTFGEVNSYLEFACYVGDIDVIKFLLEKGATKSNYRRKVCMDNIRYFHDEKYDEVDKLLKQYKKTNESVKDMMTPKPEKDIDKAWDKSVEEMVKLIMRDYKVTVKEAEDFIIEYIKTFEWQLLHELKSVEEIYEKLEITLYNFFGESRMRYNESIRTLMTPKSKEDIKQSFTDILRNINSPLNNFYGGENFPIVYLAKLMGEPLRNLHVVHEYGTAYDYDTLAKYFNLIVKRSKLIEIEEVDGRPLNDEFICYYPSKKLALWFYDRTGTQFWVFSKPFYSGKVNEGIRDMMTPRSEVEVNNTIKQNLKNIGNGGTWWDYSKYWLMGNDKIKKMIEDSCTEEEKNILRKSIRAHIENRIGEWGESNNIDDLTQFSLFQTNEGIRDKMTPLPREEVMRRVSDNPGLFLSKYKDLLTKEEIHDIVDKMSKPEQIRAILFDVSEYYDIDDVKSLLNELPTDRKVEYILGRFSVMYSTEELEEIWKLSVINSFEKAYNTLKTDVNLDYLGSRWTKYSKPFEIGKNLYEYRGKKMKIYSVESGGWYLSYLVVLPIEDTNESVRDMMKPKSEEEIETIMSSLSPGRRRIMLGEKLEDICWSPELVNQAEEYLKLGADPNYNLNPEGRPTSWTPLRYAITAYNIECVKLLIKYGANVKPIHIHEAEELPDDKPKEREDKEEIIKILNQYKTTNESVRSKMTPKSDEEIRKNLKIINPLKKLELGVLYNKPWLVKQALDEKVEITLRSEHFTLQLAVKHADYEIVKMLLDYGLKTKGHFFDLCEIARKVGKPEVIELIQQYRMKE